MHDSQAFDDLLNKGNTSSDVYADSAYRSAKTERKLKARGSGAVSTSADAAIVR